MFGTVLKPIFVRPESLGCDLFHDLQRNPRIGCNAPRLQSRLQAVPGRVKPGLQTTGSSKTKTLVHKYQIGLLTGIAAMLLLTGCCSPEPVASLHRYQFHSAHMGTRFDITLYATNQHAAEAAAEAAFRRVAELESIMSDYDADSELMRLREQPVGLPVPVSADLFDVLQRAHEISKRSGGAFDVTIGPHIRQWRFARKRKKLPTSAELETAHAAVGWQKLKLDPRARTVTQLAPGMRLDLGGIAKGYSADHALRVLNNHGIDRALVAASGDIAAGNPPPGKPGWRIAIAQMDDNGRTNALGRSIFLRNAAVSTSGDTEQFIEIDGVRYSHIVSPVTGLGLTERIQATVIAREAATTDALATAVCILGAQRGMALIESWPGTAALVVAREGDRHVLRQSKRFGHWQAPAPR
jgi:FAD:protein FMN transferase